METILSILVVILLIFLVLSIIFILLAKTAVKPKLWTLEGAKEYLINMPIMAGEKVEIENEHTIKSYDGYELYVGFVSGDPNNKHYVVLSHGYTSNRYGMYKYATLYRKLGYNCVIYDDRGHGANKPATSSFGYKESRDLMAVIEDTYNRYGEDIQLGLHGESMGSGLQIMALEYQPKIDFIVNDCGYSAILDVLRGKCEEAFRLPGWFADVASFYSRFAFGYSFHDVRPIEKLKNNTIPICFVHGDADALVEKWHSEKMYEMTKGYKELHLFEGAEHAKCIDKDKERYFSMLKNFLDKVYES